MSSYTDKFGPYGPIHDVQCVVVEAGGELFVGSDAVLISEASVSDAAISADGMASSVLGGAVVFGRPIYSQSDAGGIADPTNTADHAALKAAD
jgi:hypothetical protein